jgi:hypothetical protein
VWVRARAERTGTSRGARRQTAPTCPADEVHSKHSVSAFSRSWFKAVVFLVQSGRACLRFSEAQLAEVGADGGDEGALERVVGVVGREGVRIAERAVGGASGVDGGGNVVLRWHGGGRGSDGSSVHVEVGEAGGGRGGGRGLGADGHGIYFFLSLSVMLTSWGCVGYGRSHVGHGRRVPKIGFGQRILF